MVISRPRATMRLKGVDADEGVAADLLAVFDRLQQEALALGQAARRKAETGVSRSAVRVRQTGTRVCSLARVRNSLRLGWTGWLEAFTSD
jgi:D-serine deaminase-like pyridoxal phosphate-dependent protein